MRGVTLDPDFGNSSMRKVLKSYEQYIGPTIRTAENVLKKSRTIEEPEIEDLETER